MFSKIYQGLFQNLPKLALIQPTESKRMSKYALKGKYTSKYALKGQKL